MSLKNKKQLLENFFSLSILQLFTYILPLLTLPYLVKVLEVEKFGLIMFAQSLIIFFNIFVDFGFNLSAVKEISVYREDKKKLTEIFSSVLIIKLLLIIFSLIVLTIIIFSFNKFLVEKKLYYLTFLWVVGQALFPIWYFQGIEKMKYITIINVLSKLMFTIAIFVFVKSSEDYLLVPIFNGLGFILGGVLSLWIIFKNFNQEFKLQKPYILLKYFKESSQFFLSRVSVAVYTSANAFVLGLFTNNTMVGYYSIAEQLYKAIQGFYQPISQVLYPYIAKERNITLFKKLFIMIIFINIIGIIILYFIDSYIFDFLFTKHIASQSLEVFHILLIASLIVVPSILLGYPFLGALGFAKYANISVIYGSIFHIIGLFILSISNAISIYSVAIMVIFTELLVLSSRIYWSKRNLLWQKQ